MEGRRGRRSGRELDRRKFEFFGDRNPLRIAIQTSLGIVKLFETNLSGGGAGFQVEVAIGGIDEEGIGNQGGLFLAFGLPGRQGFVVEGYLA
ncbi:MAG: hypothetical protein BWY71_01476 [Planctomycetes bacterium ADurb.Bin412]|nr:MAG: hypothetical protein BWY71_01476 [Planctomycetes bacterium ADurb.Bin412]